MARTYCCWCGPTDSIPEPFVTFLVEVNWARGRLMREYTVLLDPPVYTPGERASSARACTAATAPTPRSRTARRASAARCSEPGADRSTATPATPARAAQAGPQAVIERDSAPSAPRAAAASATAARQRRAPRPCDGYLRVAQGDTLTKIARSLRAGSTRRDIDQTMIAMYRANPDAFGGNINILRARRCAARARSAMKSRR